MENDIREKLTQAGVNIETALERFLGNENLFLQFLRKFPKDSNYELFMAAMKEKKYEEAFNAAHAIKGICGNLSIDGFYGIISEEVEFLRHGEHQKAEDGLAKLSEEYDRVVTILNNV